MYIVPSLVCRVVDCAPDHVAYNIIRLGEEDSGRNKNTISLFINKAIALNHHHFDEINNFRAGLRVFDSRQRCPPCDTPYESFLIRFRGRSGRQSVKNIRMKDPPTDDVVLQMALERL